MSKQEIGRSWFTGVDEPEYIYPINVDIRDDALALGMHFYNHMIAGHAWSLRKNAPLTDIGAVLPTQVFIMVLDFQFAMRSNYIVKDQKASRKAKRFIDKWLGLNPHWKEWLKENKIDHFSVKALVKLYNY